MFSKGTKLNSIFKGTCPRCQEESMYTSKNPYQLSKTLEMHDQCSHCGQIYKIEPSFFYGAMYVSYAVSIAFSVAAFIISYFFLGSDLLTAFIAIGVVLIAFYPIILRVSRNIWVNIFIKYNPEAVQKYAASKH
ncbi:hypothetical protein NBRC110019_06190 [Neptunitalea chrysea]|uniref:DUF983 domain-containing protein n=1 Tax=Neptunitalea chrysea TaxID=1647581 RepID=A0A9W6B3D8_9FLAO|nr:DUF983 domain-containing protein [Neptunitalea chrysea]GLB51580.1 hypothetical protein NBRC110019_06190 [Neptunitalea chrysea]